jgi:hypothetical protein
MLLRDSLDHKASSSFAKEIIRRQKITVRTGKVNTQWKFGQV